MVMSRLAMSSLEFGVPLCFVSEESLGNTAPGLFSPHLSSVWLLHISLLVLLIWDPGGGNGAYQPRHPQSPTFKLRRSEKNVLTGSG